jgi:hypothetical protein
MVLEADWYRREGWRDWNGMDWMSVLLVFFVWVLSTTQRSFGVWQFCIAFLAVHLHYALLRCHTPAVPLREDRLHMAHL